MVRSDRLLNEVYNLGAEDYYTLVDISNYIVDCLSSSDRHVDVVVEEGSKEETYKSGINENLFYEQFNWKPQIKLYESIDRIVKAAI